MRRERSANPVPVRSRCYQQRRQTCSRAGRWQTFRTYFAACRTGLAQHYRPARAWNLAGRLPSSPAPMTSSPDTRSCWCSANVILPTPAGPVQNRPEFELGMVAGLCRGRPLSGTSHGMERGICREPGRGSTPSGRRSGSISRAGVIRIRTTLPCRPAGQHLQPGESARQSRSPRKSSPGVLA